jgi:arylsulfatase A-like enzyme
MRVLYLDLDTLRPDHLGCYGYHRNTSPNIDRIAAEGIRFDNFYASDAPCLPSRAALMTGQFGIHNGAVGHGGTAADLRLQGPSRSFVSDLKSHAMPAIFKRAGMHTAYIGGFPERHSSFWYYAGFREMHDTGKGGMESAEDVTPAALDWIARNAKKDNWYLHINYWDSHTPYRAPAEFGNPFENEPAAEWITQEMLDSHRAMPGPHGAQEINMYNSAVNPKFPRHLGALETLADVKTHIDGYDCGTAYMDSHIGQLFDAFERAGVMDDLAVIISSDHGENHGELGLYGEHATADHFTCRIPMIIRWPGAKRGVVDSGLHYNIDLPATLAELLGGKRMPKWDGVSFAPAITEGRDCGRDYLVLSQCAHVCQRSVRWGEWLYMRTYHDGYHLFPDEMLFNLDEDPHEQRNLAAERPDIVTEGKLKLSSWHDEMMSSQPYGYANDPMDTVLAEGGPEHARGFLPKYLDRLAATGRGRFVDELKRRHPQEFAPKSHSRVLPS